MLTRRYTGTKDVVLFKPTLRIQPKTDFGCDCEYNATTKEFIYWILIQDPDRRNKQLLKIFVTQSTYNKFICNSEKLP